MKHRLLKVSGQRRFGKLAAQSDHLIEEHLYAFHLDLGSWKTVQHRSVLLFRLQQLAKQAGHHLAVADHAALGLDPPRLGTIEQFADDNRLRGDVAQLANEISIGSLTRARCAPKQDELLWKTKVFTPDLLLQLLPDPPKDELGVLDFEIGRWRWLYKRRLRQGIHRREFSGVSEKQPALCPRGGKRHLRTDYLQNAGKEDSPRG